MANLGNLLRNIYYGSLQTGIPTDWTDGLHRVHRPGTEYSSVLVGHDGAGSYWQLYFHPSSGYGENIQYRATNCSSWKTILDSNNSSVAKEDYDYDVASASVIDAGGEERDPDNSAALLRKASTRTGRQLVHDFLV